MSEWWYGECLDCGEEFQYTNFLDCCPSCDSVNWRHLRADGYGCDCGGGVVMSNYNVVFRVGVDIEKQVEARDENEAREIALGQFVSRSLEDYLREVDFYATTEPEIVDSWELEDED